MLPLVIMAVALAFIAGARVLPVYAALVYGLALAGFTWGIWSFTELEVPIEQDEAINPVVRLTASLVVLSAALAPAPARRGMAWNRPRSTTGEH